ncbi:helix-turn-helix domain-containing protein [Mycobacterium sp. MBM]|nr:helix-turn-helix domain-containing protein [Mycobacterium sp. MBM]
MADLKPPAPLLDIRAVAEILGMNDQQVRDLIRYGSLPAVKIGASRNARIRVRREDLDALLIPVVPKERTVRFDQGRTAPGLDTAAQADDGTAP